VVNETLGSNISEKGFDVKIWKKNILIIL
jgi:hypothetical protein